MNDIRFHFDGMKGSPYRNSSHQFYVLGGCYLGRCCIVLTNSKALNVMRHGGVFDSSYFDNEF
jgi:hypothetical protein